MEEKGRYIRLEGSPQSELGNGFFGNNLVELDGFEMTYLTCDEGAGHGFHSHEDIEEVLVFLEGACTFTLGGTDYDVKGGSVIHAPPKIEHKVRYKEKSKILRIKIARPEK